MRIAYANTYYRINNAGGGHVHMGQFITNAVSDGHEIWSWSSNQHPEIHKVPGGYFNLIRTMRKMDALYVRLERKPSNFCRWAVPPHRLVYGFPLVVWEFNSIPEEGLLRGQSEQEVQRTNRFLKHYGRGCDLAVCMTHNLGEYVKNNFGIRRVSIVPNGSDPDLFQPDAPPVERMAPFKDKLNVVWIGSANIEYHDFGMLQEAALRLWDHKDRDRIIIHIIGSGLRGIMGDMPPNVYYWGAEYYHRLPHWLSAMDVGLYLSRGGPTDYATPLKLFDYMASGLVLVSTSQPFMRELFERLGQSDLLVSPGEAGSLAEVLINLASDRERIHRQGLSGRQLVIDYYNWRRAVQDTFNDMQTILDEKGK